jgi:hypothetical protein
VPSGELYGSHLSATEAASIVLDLSVARYEIRRGEEGFYWLWVETKSGPTEIAYSEGRPIGARVETRQLAWLLIAHQVLEANWPGITIWVTTKPSLRLVNGSVV